MTKEWMTAGSSPKKRRSVFGAWALTIGRKTVEKPAFLEKKVALEIITAFSVDVKTCLKPDRWLRCPVLKKKDAQSFHGRGHLL